MMTAVGERERHILKTRSLSIYNTLEIEFMNLEEILFQFFNDRERYVSPVDSLVQSLVVAVISPPSTSKENTLVGKLAF